MQEDLAEQEALKLCLTQLFDIKSCEANIKSLMEELAQIPETVAEAKKIRTAEEVQKELTEQESLKLCLTQLPDIKTCETNIKSLREELVKLIGIDPKEVNPSPLPAQEPQTPTPKSAASKKGPTPKPNTKSVILYVLIQGNPVHMGHMSMIAKAIDKVQKDILPQINASQETPATIEVRISLGRQNRLANKIADENNEIKKQKEQSYLQRIFQRNCPYRVLLPLETRIQFVQQAIEQFKDKFQGVDFSCGEVSNSLNVGYVKECCDLTRENPNSHVYIVMGTDLCNREMGNWDPDKSHIKELGLDKQLGIALDDPYLEPALKRAIIVTEGDKKPDRIPQDIDTGKLTRFVVDGEKAYQNYSSSAVQEGDFIQLPLETQEEFKTLHEDAQKNPHLETEFIPKVIFKETAIPWKAILNNDNTVLTTRRIWNAKIGVWEEETITVKQAFEDTTS